MSDGGLEKYPAEHPDLRLELRNASDADLAGAISGAAALLNVMVEFAARRELIITYRIKDDLKNDGLTNPRIIVSVTTEVL